MKMAAIALVIIMLAAGVVHAHTDLTPAEVKAYIDTSSSGVIVDVREESEFCDSTYSPPNHIPGAINMPWNSGYFQDHYTDLPTDEDIIIVCRSGNRSNIAANFLDAQGFTRVFDMTGGMNEWLWETESCLTASVPGGGEPPSAPALGPAVPNPFAGETEISFAIPGGEGPARVTLRIYDARGRLVKTIISSNAGPGTHSMTWDGTDDRRCPVASGLYFYRLTWNGASRTRSMVLLR